MKKKALTSWYIIAGAVILVAVAAFLSIRMFAMADTDEISITPIGFIGEQGTLYIGADNGEPQLQAELIDPNGELDGKTLSYEWGWNIEEQPDQEGNITLDWDNGKPSSLARVKLSENPTVGSVTIEVSCTVQVEESTDTGDPTETTISFGPESYTINISYDTVSKIEISPDELDLGFEDSGYPQQGELSALLTAEHGGMLDPDLEIVWSIPKFENCEISLTPSTSNYEVIVNRGDKFGTATVMASIKDNNEVNPATCNVTVHALEQGINSEMFPDPNDPTITITYKGSVNLREYFENDQDPRLYSDTDMKIEPDPSSGLVEINVDIDGIWLTGDGVAEGKVTVELSQTDQFKYFQATIKIVVKPMEVTISVDDSISIDKYSDGNKWVVADLNDYINDFTVKDSIEEKNVDLLKICPQEPEGWYYNGTLPGKYSIDGYTRDDFILDGGNENYEISLDEDAFENLVGTIWANTVGSYPLDLTDPDTDGKVYYNDTDPDVLVQFKGPNEEGWYNGVSDDCEYPLTLTDDYSDFTLYTDPSCGEEFTFTPVNGENTKVKLYIKNPDDVVYGGITVTYNYDNEPPVACVKVAKEDHTIGEIDFNNENLEYTLTVTDTASGLKTDSVKYGISDSSTEEPSKWESADVSETEIEDQYSFKVVIPAKGFLYVRMSDIAGNSTTIQCCHPLVIEDKAPKVEFEEKCNHNENDPAQTENHNSFYLETTDENDEYWSGICTVVLKLYNDNNSYSCYLTENTNPVSLDDLQPEFSGDFSLKDLEEDYFEETIADGTYTLTATVTDYCGNSSEASIDEIKVDNEAPTAEVTTNGTVNHDVDGNGTYYYNDNNAKFSVVISDNYLKYGVECIIKANEKEVFNNKVTTDKSTQPGEIDLSWLSDGTIIVTIEMTDCAKNESNKFVSGSEIKLDEDTGAFSFVLDKTAPELQSVKLDEGHYYSGEGKVYYNTSFNVVYSVKEENFASKLVENRTYLLGGNGPESKLSVSNKESITVTIPTNTDVENAVYSAAVYIEDKAGNKLLTMSGGKEDTHNVGYSVSGGTVSFNSTSLVLDTLAPKLTSVTSDSGNYYDSDKAVYYNGAFKVTYKVTEYNYDDSSSHVTWRLDQSGDGSAATCDRNHSGDSHTFTASVARKSGVESASYSSVLSVKDKAGNVLVSNVGTTGQNGVSVSNGRATSYSKFVLDTVAPVFTMDITKLNNEALSAVDGRAYYNNSTVDVTFRVEDKHLDTGLLNSAIAANTSATNYDTATVSWVNMNTAKSTGSSTSHTMPLSINSDGVYKFEVKGEDKAGNMLAKSTAESSKSGYQSTAANGSGQYWTSYYIVRDTVNPVLDLSISDNDGVFYAAQLSSIYSVTRNMPYQSYSNATARLVKTDNSPASVAYTIDSTVRSQTEGGSAYDHNDVTINFSDQQIFSITALSITDRAGNTASMNGTTNRIYLDVEHPNIDEVAPIVTLDATSTSTVRGSSGTDLYNKNVSVNATVVDPGEGVTASGLYRVYYQVLVNGDDWTGRVNVSGKGTVISEGVIGYGTSGAGYESLQGVNENITSNDVITFTFDAGTFNYNDVIIYVWAEDNSGNMLTRENAGFYNFGIDVTTPAITVRYDNNSAQNGKYFKADRVATVTITERNFDPNNTTISTQNSAVISGWTYAAGGAANGDDDSWVCTVRYHADGDYTFNVTTTDLLGHTAGAVDYGDSVAPTDFTVDETDPVITITFNNNNVMNGKYYNASRVATITINEHNFSSTGAEITPTAKIAEGTVGTPTLGAWTSAGDTNTAQMSFSQDGDFTLKASFVDLAGNEAQMVSIDEFTIDTTDPDLEIQGVEDNTAYNGYVAPSIVYSDINYDPNSPSVSITGYYNTDGRNLEGVREDDAYGGSFICDNIEETRANDDVYIAEGTIRDLAGNESSQTVVFSVNRFGSNYILSDETEELCYDKIYINEAENVQVTEINVNELDSKDVTVNVNGEINELTEGKEYSVVESSPGWHQYDYVVTTAAFDEEGAYDVIFSSVDSAGNTSSNRAIREDDNETKDQPVEFMLDWSAPEVYITGVEENKTYDAGNRTIVVNYSDNMAMDSIDLYVDDELAMSRSLEDDTIDKVSGEAEYDVQASDSAQSVWIKAVDRAGNVLEGDPLSFTVTTNGWVLYYNNKPLFFGTIAAAVVVIAAIIFFIIFFKRRKDKDENSGEQTGSPSQTV